MPPMPMPPMRVGCGGGGGGVSVNVAGLQAAELSQLPHSISMLPFNSAQGCSHHGSHADSAKAAASASIIKSQELFSRAPLRALHRICQNL